MKRNYKDHLVIGDAIAYGVLVTSELILLGMSAGKVGEPDVMLGLALSGPVISTIGSPIAHLAHGYPGRAALSFLMRTSAWGIGLGGGVALTLAACPNVLNDPLCFMGMTLGASVATLGLLAVAFVIDYELMSSEPPVRHGVKLDTSGLRYVF